MVETASTDRFFFFYLKTSRKQRWQHCLNVKGMFVRLFDKQQDEFCFVSRLPFDVVFTDFILLAIVIFSDLFSFFFYIEAFLYVLELAWLLIIINTTELNYLSSFWL